MADPNPPHGSQQRLSVTGLSTSRMPSAGQPSTPTPQQSQPLSTTPPGASFEFNEPFSTISQPSVSRGNTKGRHVSTRARALARGSLAGVTSVQNGVFAVQLDGDDGGVEMRVAHADLLSAVRLRANYKSRDKGQLDGVESGHGAGTAAGSAAPPRSLHLEDGIFSFAEQRTVPVPWEEFYDAVTTLLNTINKPSCQRACRRRLHVLEQKYKLYVLCNGDAEKGTDRYRKGAGLFSDACRVDNGLFFEHAMTAPQLIDFMQQKIALHSDDLVASTRHHETAGETPETLSGVCALLSVTEPQSLTPEALGLQPLSEKPIASYDPLDPSMNPGGTNNVELLRLFMTRSTLNNGAYLAEEVKATTLDVNESRVRCPQATEAILDITGMLPEEWERLASWVREHHLTDYRTNRFQIRITPPPRRRRGGGGNGGGGGGGVGTASAQGPTGDGSAATAMPTGAEDGFDTTDNVMGSHRASRFNLGVTPMAFDNHQQYLDNLFLPLFHATLAPEDPKNAHLAHLLTHVGALDLVMDAVGSGDLSSVRRRRRPADVPWSEPVDDLYLAYYVWANVCSLNAFRRRRGMNLLQLRATAGHLRGSSSPKTGLVISYLLCDHVLDGLALIESPVLQYLFALHRIGVSVSPTASSSLGATTYMKHPLLAYLRSGLRVSLSTRSPLLFHVSAQPLVEEHNTARRLFRLSGADLCELALNSVTMSSFDAATRANWIGEPFAVELERLLYRTSRTHHSTAEATTTAAGAGAMDATQAASGSISAVPGALSSATVDLAASFVNNDVLSEAWRYNAVDLTSVPTARLEFRWDTWMAELDVLVRAAQTEEKGHAASGIAHTAHATALPNDGTPAEAANASTGALVEKGNKAEPIKRASLSLRTGHMSSGTEEAPLSLTQWPPLHAMGSAGARARAPYVVVDPALDFPRVVLAGSYDRETQFATAAQALARALELRSDYMRQLRCPDDCGGDVRCLFALIQNPLYQTEEAFKNSGGKRERGGASDGYMFDEDEWMYKTVEGVVVPHEVHQIPRLPQDMYRFDDFKHHVEELRALMENPLVRRFAMSRLRMLERRFSLHVAVNHSREAGSTAAKASQNRDFYQSTKVDNTVRMECGTTSRQLLDFIISKAHNNGDDIVSHQRGKEPQTLRQLLQELNISVDSLTVDDLNVQGDAASGGEPSALYKPDGRDELLTLVLKTDNRMNGRYFAELTKHVFDNMKRDRYTFSENRLPIYGKGPEEWSLLSSWFDTHGMSSSHNQWVIQLPRVYGYLRKKGCVQNFAEYLENIFKPLWSISLHPSKDPRLFHCVNHITGFDCVEDEHRHDVPLHTITLAPHEWVSEDDPPYNYYLYHLWANVSSLNEFRRRRRFSTFTLRPSCGESGSLDHLIGGFLVANSISYGVQLKEDDVLQYLYYLAQVGVTLCPLSNNSNVLSYLDHPFPKFFRRGLKVSLGTDSPLLYHHTQEPLIEEYSIASKIWKLSPNDMCEIARNSVLLSGFSPVFKQERLGDVYFLSSSRSNDASRTHLSDIRVAYRYEALHSELGFLEYISGHSFPRPLLTLSEEATLAQEYMHRVRQLREQPLQGLLIDANPDSSDLDTLQRTRAHMQRQLEELHTTLSGLQKQNKQLTEKLAEEREREQQVTVMRRHHVEARTNDELQGYERLLLQQHMSAMTPAERSAFQERLAQEEPGALLAELNAANRIGGMGSGAVGGLGSVHHGEASLMRTNSDDAEEDAVIAAVNRTAKAWHLQESPGDWGMAMDDFYPGQPPQQSQQTTNNASLVRSVRTSSGSGLPSGPSPGSTPAPASAATWNRGALLGFSEIMWRKEGGDAQPSQPDAGTAAAAAPSPPSTGRGWGHAQAALPPVRANRTSSATFASVPSAGRPHSESIARTVPPR